MNPGFVLLGSHLGDPDRRILSPSQLRTLTDRMQRAGICHRGDLGLSDLRSLGYGPDMGTRILNLLSQQEEMEAYLRRGREAGCFPLTRGEEAFPALARKRLGGECPCCLFYKGDPSLLNTPAIALAGSRDLSAPNRAFAEEAGRQAAAHGMTLISGNARGADRAAQDACLAAGGKVISIVADDLLSKSADKNILYLSQEDYDLPFSSQRALSRNRLIHTMGYMTLVVQCALGHGGTWSGTAQNLQQGWSMVVCFRDGSPASLELQNRGAWLLDSSQLSELSNLREPQLRFADL